MAKTVIKTLNDAKKHILDIEGDDTIISLEGKVKPMPHISTGSFLIDYITGIGGIPLGRIIECYGLESSGKTTVMTSCAVQCQKVLKKAVLYLDYEHALDKKYMIAQGVDLSDDKFIYVQPTYMEQGFRIAEFYMKTGFIGLVIADSVAAMKTQAEMEGDIGDPTAGGVAHGARIMAQTLKKLAGICSNTNVAFAFINQLRLGLPMTPFEKAKGIKKETTPGGSALKFYSTMRLKFTKIGGVKGKLFNAIKGEWEDGLVATKIKCELIKNKVAPPFRSCEFIIRYGIGVDDVMSIILVAIDRKMIKKNGAFLKVPAKYRHDKEEKNIQGLEKVCTYFREAGVKGFKALSKDLKDAIDKDMKYMETRTEIEDSYALVEDGPTQELPEELLEETNNKNKTVSL